MFIQSTKYFIHLKVICTFFHDYYFQCSQYFTSNPSKQYIHSADPARQCKEQNQLPDKSFSGKQQSEGLSSVLYSASS